MYIFHCYSLNSCHTVLPPLCPMSVLYICISIPALQIGSSVPFFLTSSSLVFSESILQVIDYSRRFTKNFEYDGTYSSLETSSHQLDGIFWANTWATNDRWNWRCRFDGWMIRYTSGPYSQDSAHQARRGLLSLMWLIQMGLGKQAHTEMMWSGTKTWPVN